VIIKSKAGTRHGRKTPERAAPKPSRVPLLPIAAILIALVLLAEYVFALHGPFVGDDYVFIEKVEHASFLSLWEPRALAFHYFRPWSREFHFWALIRAFGVDPFPFHVASLLLAFAAGLLYFQLARRLAGDLAAATTTAAGFSLASWGVLLFWASGSQDLWMIVFALCLLLALTYRRPGLALVFQVFALLSKETSAVLPAVALVYELVIERRRPREALARTAWLWVVVGLWAVFHPMVGGGWWHPIPREDVLPGLQRGPVEILSRALGSLVNIDEWPRPVFGWAFAVNVAIPASAGLLALLAAGLWNSRTGRRSIELLPAPRAAAVAVFGASWALLAWLPLFKASLGFHAYYGLLGALGAWLALGTLLARWPAFAVTVVLSLALLRSARSMTRSTDWGTEWFQRRAEQFGVETRAFLRARYPTFPPYSRVYLSSVPPGVGLVPGGEQSPALRVWYGDTTLETHFFSRFRARSAGRPAGNDYFFRYDSTSGWRELAVGPEDLRGRPARDPAWALEQQDLMSELLGARDWKDASSVARKLVAVRPDQVDAAFNLAVCFHNLGEMDSAAYWYRYAARLPGATPEMQEALRDFGGAPGRGAKR
jgi:hypothetical protein